MVALNVSKRDDHCAYLRVLRLLPRRREEIHGQREQYSTREAVGTAPSPRCLGRLSWWRAFIPEPHTQRQQAGAALATTAPALARGTKVARIMTQGRSRISRVMSISVNHPTSGPRWLAGF